MENYYCVKFGSLPIIIIAVESVLLVLLIAVNIVLVIIMKKTHKK